MKADLSHRRARGFFHYLGLAIRRVGFEEGQIIVRWHNGKVARVSLLASVDADGRDRKTGSSPEGYSLKAMECVFLERLRRLLRGLTFDYGTVEINVVRSAIRDALFAVRVRPSEARKLCPLMRRIA